LWNRSKHLSLPRIHVTLNHSPLDQGARSRNWSRSRLGARSRLAITDAVLPNTSKIACHNCGMNTEENLEKLVQAGSGLLGYFDQQALASYRNDPHKFAVETDSFEGTLTLAQDYYRQLEESGNTDEWINLKFGYRALDDGDLAIVLWLPDLMKAKSHQARWTGFYFSSPSWAASDERFEKWVRRYIGGAWEIENGPKFKVSEILAEINGLTEEMVGCPLYNHFN